MKLIYTTLLLSALSCSAADYINYIRETHFLSDDPLERPVIEMHNDISNADTTMGKLGVLNKTVYDLYVLETAILKEHHLDTKTVYTDAPAAALSITSDDIKTDRPRTRADKPFYVTYTLKNLTPESELDNPRFNSVILQSESSDGKTTTEKLTKNTDLAKKVAYWPLDLMSTAETTRVDPTAVSGEIKFTINENRSRNADEFASQSILVLPKHKGTLRGLEAGEKYRTMPTITLDLVNMYPGSTAVLYVYKNDNPSNVKYISGNGKLLALKNDGITPTDSTHTVNDAKVFFADEVDEEGEWTLVWELTGTPWEDETIAKIPFTMLKTLKVRASITGEN